MGKIKEILNRRAAAAIGKIAGTLAVAALVVGVPAMQSIRTAAANKDYDASIAALEKEIEEKRQANKDREAKINSYTGDINENKEAINEISELIDGVNDEIASKGLLITAKMGEITDKEAEIAAVEKSIEDKELEILDKREEIRVLEKQNNENLERFSKLARALYISDSSDTIPLLSGSDDWYNFFVYTDVVQNISAQNIEFMNRLLANIKNQEGLIVELNEDIEQLNRDKDKLQNDKTKLEQEQADLEAKQSELQSFADEQYNNLYSIAAQNEALKNKIDGLSYAISITNDEIEELNNQVAEEIRRKQAANAGQTIYSSDGFRWPLEANFKMITTKFGYDGWRGGNHYGIDVGNAGIAGTNVYAAQSGTVITAYSDGGWHGGYGNYVVVDHGGGISTLYAHCSSTIVYEGQTVNKGDVLGYVGMTGWATGNHLHFEVRVNGTAVDPFGYAYEYV
ncbi:MAG: peptidoglycan DD-metalloendopeptidase family protein [Oscillospiraceae bacterium]|nr:peptidoglycan DD-metalloendopeptidase family protein [Oscillospiraceae bacterium]